jgi:hypothetical protein
MKHLLLVGCQRGGPDLLLDVLEVLAADVEGLDVLWGAEEQLLLGELFWKGSPSEIDWLQDTKARALESTLDDRPREVDYVLRD